MRLLYHAFVYAYGIICVLFCTLPLYFLFVKFSDSVSMKWFSRHKVGTFTICLATICGILYFTSNHPVMYCPPEYESRFNDSMREEIVEISRGTFPFIVYSISVQSIEDDSVVYEANYLFVGNSIRVIGPDGADVIKKAGKQ